MLLFYTAVRIEQYLIISRGDTCVTHHLIEAMVFWSENICFRGACSKKHNSLNVYVYCTQMLIICIITNKNVNKVLSEYSARVNSVNTINLYTFWNKSK